MGMIFVILIHMRYKIALSIWNNKVSPVMDTASQLMVIEYEDKKEVMRMLLNIPHFNVVHKAEFLKDHGIDLLICGAISMQMHQILTASHIEVIPFIRGSIGKVLAAYNDGDLQNGDFFLPGYRQNIPGFRRIRCRRRGKY